MRLVQSVGAILALVSIVIAMGVSAQAQQVPAAPAAPTGPAALNFGGGANFNPDQPIRPGFVVAVTTLGEPDWTGQYLVDQSGNIQMKLVNTINILGLSASEAQDKIAALLKQYIVNPKVTVSIVSVPQPIVFLSGAVPHPGPTQITQSVRLADLLTTSGWTDSADLTHIRIVSRDQKGNITMHIYNFASWLKPLPGQLPDESQNPLLHDRDLIYVPIKVLPGSGVVTVEGAVVKPGPVDIRIGVPFTVREAISAAGGPIMGSVTGAGAAAAPTQMVEANRLEVSVQRLGESKPLSINIAKAEQGDPVNNIALHDGDVIYVKQLPRRDYYNMVGGFMLPGRKFYSHTITLTQAIGDAGGVLPYSKLKQGRIYRHPVSGNPLKTQIIAFNWGKIRSGKEPDIELQPGDTIEIPAGRPSTAPSALQVLGAMGSLAFFISVLTRGY